MLLFPCYAKIFNPLNINEIGPPPEAPMYIAE
jgi:hypothetical protein